MKRTQIRNVSLTLAAGLVPAILLAFSMGPDPRHTGAPGDKSKACATGGCHTSAKTGEGGPINFHGGGVTATFSSGSTYTPGGTPISITVQVSDPQNSQSGFQMTARLESNLATAQAGRFNFISGQTLVLCDDNRVRTATGSCLQSAPVEFIEHSRPSSAPWTFTWTPPTAAAGPVHFYVAGNAVNGNGAEDAGDHVYTNEYVLTPAGACPETRPAISAVISAGAFGARNDFASGSWLEIYGANLATNTREWGGQDFQGSNAPTKLDQVSVAINGKQAFTRFISPGQVNVQAPADEFIGAANITVTNCDQTSTAFSLPKNPAAPGLLAPPSFNIGGRQFLVATFADGVTYVGNIPGLNSRPAKPGDLIIAYGIGFGPTSPASAPGTIVPALNALTGNLTVTIGGVQVPSSSINYAGLTPGFIGLYQFNIVVPEVPDGDQPVTFRLGTETLPQSLFLRVQR